MDEFHSSLHFEALEDNLRAADEPKVCGWQIEFPVILPWKIGTKDRPCPLSSPQQSVGLIQGSNARFSQQVCGFHSDSLVLFGDAIHHFSNPDFFVRCTPTEALCEHFVEDQIGNGEVLETYRQPVAAL